VSDGLVYGGAVLALIGSFLTWATVEAGGASATVSGMDGDGPITLVLAIATAVFWFLRKRTEARWPTFLAAAGGVLTALVAIIDIADVNRVAGDLGDFADASVGIGLWLVLIGGVAATVGALLNR
jgi:hypothetical protein